ncbi:hypothetical protein JHK87_055731 [Glycine soja]|nr:hypothetical protein JHK86_055470 [Glycine max]KAG4909615.1 hypothetical protein JHK87_055731 [Glycine soja]
MEPYRVLKKDHFPHTRVNEARKISEGAITWLTAEELLSKTKGRGFGQDTDANCNTRLSGTDFDSLTTDGGPSP